MATIQNSPKASGGPGSSRDGPAAPRTRSAPPIRPRAASGSRSRAESSTKSITRPSIGPQIRDLQFLVTDGETFFHDERRDLEPTIEYLDEHGLGVRIINVEPEGRYRHRQGSYRRSASGLRADRYPARRRRRLCWTSCISTCCSRRISRSADGATTATSAKIAGREFLTAHKNDTWLAMAATAPFISALMRLCRHDRRMAGSGRQLQAGLSVRRAPRTAISR